jgi:hypothetical protein
MPLTVPLPYGLRDLKVRTFASGSEVPGAAVDLPNARTFSFAEAEEFDELRGDDGLRAVHGRGPTVNWGLEGGGISLEATKALFGGTISETGVTPNQQKTYTKAGSDQRPYFQIEGQAISDSGGDFHAVVYKARCTGELSGELADGTFWLTGASGQGLPRLYDDLLYSFIQNETAKAIGTVNEVQTVTITGTPTGGTFTLTFMGETTTPIVFNAAASVVQAALEALAAIPVGGVVCTGGPLPGTVTCTFTGELAGLNVPQMTGSAAGLTGGTTPALTIATTVQGG